jgi:hypothetical protein
MYCSCYVRIFISSGDGDGDGDGDVRTFISSGDRDEDKIAISTNNIAIGLVRIRKIRFQPTQYVFVRCLAARAKVSSVSSRRSFIRFLLKQNNF